MMGTSQRAFFRALTAWCELTLTPPRSLRSIIAETDSVQLADDESIKVQTLPFLRIPVAACAHCHVMSNSILVDRLVRAVIPYITESILPRPETNNKRGRRSSKDHLQGRGRGELECSKATRF